jgi:hypothetical protein
MHKMPDGTMMKDSEHKMAMGGMAMGLERLQGRKMTVAQAGRTNCKMR